MAANTITPLENQKHQLPDQLKMSYFSVTTLMTLYLLNKKEGQPKHLNITLLPTVKKKTGTEQRLLIIVLQGIINCLI